MGEATIIGFIGEIPKKFKIAYSLCICTEREVEE